MDVEILVWEFANFDCLMKYKVLFKVNKAVDTETKDYYKFEFVLLVTFCNLDRIVFGLYENCYNIFVDINSFCTY